MKTSPRPTGPMARLTACIRRRDPLFWTKWAARIIGPEVNRTPESAANPTRSANHITIHRDFVLLINDCLCLRNEILYESLSITI